MGACSWGIMLASFLLHGGVPPGMAVFSLCCAKSVVSVVTVLVCDMCRFESQLCAVLLYAVCSLSLCYVQS